MHIANTRQCYKSLISKCIDLFIYLYDSGYMHIYRLHFYGLLCISLMPTWIFLLQSRNFKYTITSIYTFMLSWQHHINAGHHLLIVVIILVHHTLYSSLTSGVFMSNDFSTQCKHRAPHFKKSHSQCL